MSTTTTQTVSGCPCCGVGYCNLCASEASGTATYGIMASVLHVTFYMNAWSSAAIGYGYPYCDCLNSGTVDAGFDSPFPPSSANMPPTYYPNALFTGILAPISFPLTWDPNYIVKFPFSTTGCWVYRQYSCSSLGSGTGSYYAMIVKFGCIEDQAYLAVSWHTSSAGFESSGTGTGTADYNGDPDTYYGLFYGLATNGNKGSYENSCDPPYFVFGQTDVGLASFLPYAVPASVEGPFIWVRGLDQQITGNIMDPSGGYIPTITQMTAVISL